jgi:hypothetical protein
LSILQLACNGVLGQLRVIYTLSVAILRRSITEPGAAQSEQIYRSGVSRQLDRALPNFRLAQVYRPMLIVGTRSMNGAPPFCSRSKLPYLGSAAARLPQSVWPCGFGLDFRRAWCEKESATTRRKQLRIEHEIGQILAGKARHPFSIPSSVKSVVPSLA